MRSPDAVGRVVVLGAGGYVGGAILRALRRTGRLQAVAAGRRSIRDADSVVCDATDAGAVARALDGAGCVVNAVLGPAETMLAATRNVCAVAARDGARVVHISSMAVYGDASGLVEESAPLSGSSPYAAAKVACERVIADHISAGGDAVILRPGIVHGPRGEQWTGRLGRMLLAGRLGDLGRFGDGRCNLTCIDDLGAAALAAVERPEAAGQAFNVADPEPATWNQFLTAFGVRIGRRPVARVGGRRLRAEARLLAPPLQALKILAGKAGLRPGALPEPLTPSLLVLFGQDMALSHDRADRVLGFARTPPALALEAACMWFLATHTRG